MAHQANVDGGTTRGNQFTTAKQKSDNNKPLSDEEAVAHQANVDGGTTRGNQFTTAAMKLLANEPLSIEEDAARQTNVDGGITAGGMKRKAMFDNGAVGVWLKCGKCERGKTCGIYPKGHENELLKPRNHGCPHCRKTRSFYTEEELEVRRKHRQETGRTYWQCSFDYGLLNSL